MADKYPDWLQGWKLVLVIYAVLLIASHIVRTLNPDHHEPEPDQKTIQLNHVSGDTVLENSTLQLAYREVYNGNKSDPPTILLLHGSPIGVPMLPDLISALAKENRVIAPDFPGYDASDRKIPDYSMKSYSVYMKQLLDSLGVEKTHILGYSMGGGVGIYMSHLAPEKVESMVLLSGLGVQELELMGSYYLNHAIHGGQLALIWLLHELVPHFGLLRDFPLNVPYARSFYDSDQRPLRSYLKQYRKPMLIQHGRDDALVPLAAAREHHRIVPQSELKLYDGDHGIVLTESERIAQDISQFIDRVESGEALSYSEASKKRIREAQKPFEDINFAKVEGITLIILMLIIIFSTWISEDLTCIGAGLLAARGIIGFWPATVACFIGIFVGDVGLYLIGRWLGRPAVKRAPVKWFLSEKDLEQSADWFKARGPAIIIASRFIPGSRFPTYFSAGVIGAGFWMFTLYFILAAIFWTPLLVGISMLVGTELIRYFEVYKNYAIWVLIAAVFMLFLFFKFVIPVFTWRGRRMIISRWHRLTRWEFWSPYIIYLPVVFYITFLWVKYGKLTMFTAANPGIEDGGFIGESKSKILEMFSSSGSVAPYHKIPGNWSPDQKITEALSFMEDMGLSFPVVIKPDAGQRGRGVRIPKNENEMRVILEDREYDQIIQKFVEGCEFGVFYYRYPDRQQCDIFSITEKKLLTLTGDGEKTLEELILDDSRAVSLAKYHIRRHREHIYDIPEKGEGIQLVELGAHARGALFLDGEELITPKLRQSLDSIVESTEGFYFGRFDLKVPDREYLKRGKNMTIIEVNGVTSEATSIYDPDNSFIKAVKKLCRQWELAFQIGEQNLETGVKLSSTFSLISKLVAYRNKY